MSNEINREWLLRHRPEAMVGPEHFEYREVPVAPLPDNHALVRTLFLSFDPAQRGWLNDAPSYVPPVRIGEPMRALGIGQVVQSRQDDLKPGDLVQGILAWQDYVSTADLTLGPLRKITADLPLTHELSIYGLTGLTAYMGMKIVGAVRGGDVVVVSGAAGATGSVAGQIARVCGAAQVIGIAGSEEKCRWLIEETGFDAAIDYRREKISQRLRQLAPNGIDVFFDNVGGEALDAVLLNLALHARVVICGGISGGYGVKIPPGPKHYMQLVFKRATMQGFLMTHYADRMGEARSALEQWVNAGALHFREDIAEGLELAPLILRRLFEGKNFGKQLLKVADAPLPLTGRAANDSA